MVHQYSFLRLLDFHWFIYPIPSISHFRNMNTSATDTISKLEMGWAIPVRSNRRLSNLQKNFLNKLFDDGETSGVKVSPEHALKLMREEFDPINFLPLSSIKSYFGRRKKAILDGRSQLGEVLPADKVTATKSHGVDVEKDKAAVSGEEKDAGEIDAEDNDDEEDSNASIFVE
jgi:hypothetical protein